MGKANQVSIPYLDPTVQHVGISKLRALNVTQLRGLDKTLVIQDNDKPLAVLLSRALYGHARADSGSERLNHLFSVASRTTRSAFWLLSTNRHL